MKRPAVKPSYQQVISGFSWQDALHDLGWTDASEVDLPWTIVDRHCQAGSADSIAIRWIAADGSERNLTFGEMSVQVARLTSVLIAQGVREGDRVAVYLPKIAEVMIVMLAILRAGGIVVPIFSGFGSDATAFRLSHSGCKAIVTSGRYRVQLPDTGSLKVLVLRDKQGLSTLRPGDIDFFEAMADALDAAPRIKRKRSDPAFIIYTSGSTGQPKGCVIAANILMAMWPYARYGLDLDRDNDVFWPTGDPSWGYGLCCYLPALAMGMSVLSVEANATVAVCADIMDRFKVTNLATTPTVLRGLMADPSKIRDWSVRTISSCGEPLNGEVVEFFRRRFGVTPMDHFGATEFGLPIGNHNSIVMDVKAGSMGLPAPGQTMAIVNEDGQPLARGEVGLIAQQTSSESLYWLRYWNDERASAKLQHSEWVCTGDLGRQDQDGYFWFEGRADDMIKSSGYRVGPFEIESAILKHPDIVEVAAVGVPDEMRGEVIKVYIVLANGCKPEHRMSDQIVGLVKEACGRHLYPRVIEYVDALPKTESGKIQRFLLRKKSAASEVAR